jgi:phage-related protein
MKPVIWMGQSREGLREFPDAARGDAGYELDKVQRGGEPSDWKPMPSVGAGVREIRVQEESGAFRVIYLASRPEGVYVLHCFQKKTQKTSRHDLELATERFKRLPPKNANEK